ncbi:MAG: hypothetical protein ABL882_01390 [Sphingopyxis sp.]
MRAAWRTCAALACAAALMGQSARNRDRDAVRDPANPTCPQTPNWTDIQQMTLTPITRNGVRILLAEGVIDAGLPERLRAVLVADPLIDEIWLRSPGGNARAGTEAGRIIRGRFAEAGTLITTRIPNGWTCFSACNFMYLGGSARILEPSGVFMVHMFTFTNDRGAIRYSVDQGAEATTELIGDVEQESALLASEDNDFLVRMGIPRALLTEVMYRQRAVASGATPAQRYCLNRSEAERYRVHRPPTNDE